VAGGLLALALATFGVFGMFAFVVEERRREIGFGSRWARRSRRSFPRFCGSRAAPCWRAWRLGLLLSLASGRARAGAVGLSPFDPISFGIGRCDPVSRRHSRDGHSRETRAYCRARGDFKEDA
jgi:hypothetical protein